MQFLDSIVVSIPACHAGDPGSIPGRGALFFDPGQSRRSQTKTCRFAHLTSCLGWRQEGAGDGDSCDVWAGDRKVYLPVFGFALALLG